MFTRFKRGLFYPSEIINYRSEKKIKTFLYFIILVLLSVLPGYIVMLGDSNLTYADKKIVREEFIGLDIPYKIENNELVATGFGEEDYLIVNLTESFYIVFTELDEVQLSISPFSIDSYIILSKTKVVYQRAINHIDLFEYSEYANLKNLDFLGATNDDYDFWKLIFPIVNNQIDRFSTASSLVNAGALLLISLVSLSVLGLIISFFQKLFLPFVKFGELFQLMIYALTPYVVGQLLSSLFGFVLIAYVGMFMTVIYASKLSRGLMQR